MRPVDLGYTMPAEWAPHAGLLDGLAEAGRVWREHIEAAREDYVRVARAIARFEPLTMIADPDQAADARRQVWLFRQRRFTAHRRLMAARLGADLPRECGGRSCRRRL